MHSNIHCSILYNSQDVEVPIDRQMDKEDVLYKYTYLHGDGNLTIVVVTLTCMKNLSLYGVYQELT